MTVAAGIVAALLVAGIVGLSLYAYSHQDRIYEGIMIGDVSVGGMSRDAAGAAVQERYDAYARVPFSVVAGDEVFPMTPADAGATLERDATVDAAFSVGRQGTFWERSGDWARGLLRGTTIAPRIRVDQGQLDGRFAQIAATVDREPSNAFVDMDTVGRPELVHDGSGGSLGQRESRGLIRSQIQAMMLGSVELPLSEVSARILASQLSASLPGARAAVSAPLTLTSAERTWSIPFDALRTVVSVAESGALTIDDAALATSVADVAAELDRAAVNSGIVIGESGSLTVVPGSYSAVVDQTATASAAAEALRSGFHAVGVTIDRSPPPITDAEAHAGVVAAEALIGAGLSLKWDDGDARLERADLARALVLEPRPDSAVPFAVSIDADFLAEVLFPITERIDVAVQDASFRPVDGTVTLVSREKGGRATNSAASVEAILAALNDRDPSAELRVVDIEPTVRASQLDEITVPDLLGDSFTYYGNSSEPRRQNVERAGDLEAGWLVPPDGVFSYVEHIGVIDEESGFATGFGIVAGEEGGVTTAPVIGVGICQVSTTIFQAAFWSGLQIEERWQHPFWLTSYGQPPRGMKGLDAMVNVEVDWALDMKFRNTTQHWIAVVVTYDGQNVTARIMGTDPGWDVSVSEPVLTKVVPRDEKMYYTESSELPAGQEIQVESALEGFDSAITPTVVDDGEVIDEYVLTSSFAPSRNTILRGTGRG